MRRLIILLIILVKSGWVFAQPDNIPSRLNHRKDVITLGEVVEYKVSLGFVTVGKAQIKTGQSLYRINGRPCYKIDVRGKTSGAIGWVAAVDDNWGGYVDTASLLPMMGYRNIKENNYRKNEITKFDQNNQMIELKTFDQKKGDFKESQFFKVLQPVWDLVSGYSFLRSVDYQNLTVGDTIPVYAMFEDEFYDFNVMYAGKETIKTKVGKVNAIKLIPLMPDNELFDGKNSVSLWLSDDVNKIPLKAEAKMFIGTAGCEIINYEGLKSKIQVIE